MWGGGEGKVEFGNGNSYDLALLVREYVCGGEGVGEFKFRELKITPNEDQNISLISFLVPFPVHKSDVHRPHSCVRFCGSGFWYKQYTVIERYDIV